MDSTKNVQTSSHFMAGYIQSSCLQPPISNNLRKDTISNMVCHIMKFKATELQVLQIAANAVNASNPGDPHSMGWLHYSEKVFTPEDIKFTSRGVSLDYVGGRMVKLTIRTTETPEVFYIRNDLDIEYQSWVTKYPTVQSLIESVKGTEIINDET